MVAFVSPFRGAFLNDSAVGQGTINSSADITSNLIGYYAPITSSSYCVFDSGYKYMFDRFTDTFRYVPLNGDIAGTCARNDINNLGSHQQEQQEVESSMQSNLHTHQIKHREMFYTAIESTL